MQWGWGSWTWVRTVDSCGRGRARSRRGGHLRPCPVRKWGLKFWELAGKTITFPSESWLGCFASPARGRGLASPQEGPTFSPGCWPRLAEVPFIFTGPNALFERLPPPRTVWKIGERLIPVPPGAWRAPSLHGLLSRSVLTAWWAGKVPTTELRSHLAQDCVPGPRQQSSESSLCSCGNATTQPCPRGLIITWAQGVGQDPSLEIFWCFFCLMTAYFLTLWKECRNY